MAGIAVEVEERRRGRQEIGEGIKLRCGGTGGSCGMLVGVVW